MIDDLNSSPLRSVVRPVLLLTGCIVGVALVLLPIAWNRAGSGGPAGLAIAAAVCLIPGLVAEVLSFALRRQIQPLGLMLLGMAIRIAPPLGMCMFLAAQGARGRDHLAFIFYLLAFYMATLALETWLNIKRDGHARTN